ncbi:MAG: hypothetical protein K1X74_00575 [Pirellulales bacterium]|nr:hypothetical protein [Pirellulales bacterium]
MTRLGDDVTGTFVTGQQTVGTSAVALVASTLHATRGVQLKAAATNTGTVYVGRDATVTAATGFGLAAGEGLLVKVDDAAKVYLIASAAGQKVEYLVV